MLLTTLYRRQRLSSRLWVNTRLQSRLGLTLITRSVRLMAHYTLIPRRLQSPRITRRRFTATIVGEVSGGDAINYSLSTAALKFSNVGDYPITVTLGSNPNYTVTPTDGTLHIDPKAATVTADNKSKTYGDDNPSFTA